MASSKTCRTRASSGSPYEPRIGFSRAVRVGDRIWVSGTAPLGPDGTTVCRGDARGQAKRCLEIIVRAIEELGGAACDVVRTRIVITDRRDSELVGLAHGEVFGKCLPASSMFVAKLLEDDWLVEIEADAIVGASKEG